MSTTIPTTALARPVFNRMAGKCDGDHGMPVCSNLDGYDEDGPRFVAWRTP